DHAGDADLLKRQRSRQAADSATGDDHQIVCHGPPRMDARPGCCQPAGCHAPARPDGARGWALLPPRLWRLVYPKSRTALGVDRVVVILLADVLLDRPVAVTLEMAGGRPGCAQRLRIGEGGDDLEGVRPRFAYAFDDPGLIG